MNDSVFSLVMLRNESDILDEWCRHHSKFSQNWFVLNGSPDEEFEKEKAILSKYPQVKFLIRDKDTGYAGRTRDGWRRVLLEEAHKQGFSNGWGIVAHPDEFMTSTPEQFQEMLQYADDNQIHNITLLVHIFFLHTSQQDTWSFVPGEDSIQHKATHYAFPGHVEYRLFKNNPNTQYNAHKHSWVLPEGINSKIHHWDKPLKAYTWRNPQQFIERSKDRVMNHWQMDSLHYKTGINGEVFKEHLTLAEGAETRTTMQYPLPIIE